MRLVPPAGIPPLQQRPPEGLLLARSPGGKTGELGSLPRRILGMSAAVFLLCHRRRGVFSRLAALRAELRLTAALQSPATPGGTPSRPARQSAGSEVLTEPDGATGNITLEFKPRAGVACALSCSLLGVL